MIFTKSDCIRKHIIFPIFLFSCCLCACHKTYTDKDVAIGLDSAAVADIPNHSQIAAEHEVTDQQRAYEYGRVLWDLYYTGILPNETQLPYLRIDDAKQSGYCVLDVDGDGATELLILWVANNNYTIILDYDGSEVYTELYCVDDVHIFNNGFVQEDLNKYWLSSDIPPSFIHEYDAEHDVYQCTAIVCAWDDRTDPRHWDGTSFPKYADKDNDRLVYLVENPNMQHDASAKVTEYSYILDKSDYERWVSSYLGDGEEIPLLPNPIDEEHISQLGYPNPNPDFVIPEPVG